jgi:short-subunit dehydrogenase
LAVGEVDRISRDPGRLYTSDAIAPSVSGKTILVTGATSGIGLEASVKLAGMGAELLLVGRDIVHLAASSDVEGQNGGYYEGNRKVLPSRLAQDKAVATELWKRSAALVGLPI